MSECHTILTFLFFVSFGIKYDRPGVENFNLKLIHMAKISIKPLSDRVIIEPALAEEKTAGGIIIPDTAKEKPQRGTVVAVGPGKKDEPLTVKVDDQVLYAKYAGTEISYEGKNYLIMREADIVAVL